MRSSVRLSYAGQHGLEVRKYLSAFRERVVAVFKRLKIIALGRILSLELQDPVTLRQNQIFRGCLHLRVFKPSPAGALDQWRMPGAAPEKLSLTSRSIILPRK